MEDPTNQLWEAHATWWQDEFTDGADPEYVEQILPLSVSLLEGAQRILDIGTGEGQIARVLAAEGATVVGIDPTLAQVAEAERRGGGPSYARAGAADLPVASTAFDAAIACLVFEHIDEVGKAIAEVARVLKPGGRFVFMLNHPLLQTPQAGWIDDHMVEPPEQYWRIGPYLEEDESVEEVQKDVFIRFIHRPLSRYVNTLSAHGLVIDQMLEPAPPPGFLAKTNAFDAAAAIPRLLVLVCKKQP